MADIQYLNYGDQQIDQQAFLTKAANEVQGYIQKQPWSKKRKEKFMSAYSDLMNRGIQGASNGSGQWMIDVGGDVLPFDTMDKKDKEMYQEAAYFIQQQMAGLPTKASLEEDEKKKEEEEKKDLPLFDNKYFTEGLHSYIGNQMFGGRDWSTSEDWNPLDERGENGIRGHQNRALKLAEMLEGYSNSLDETKLNFENSPFKDLNDFKSRLNNAVAALRTKTPDDDKDALNQIGLRSSDYFNNGGDDQFTKGDFTGTYNQYYNEYLPQQQKAKQDAVIAQQKAERANQYDNYRFLNFLNGTPGTEEEFNLIGQKLAGQQKLDGNDVSKISWAFRQGIKSGGLENLSKEELAKFGPRYAGTPNRLKKLPGLEGIYYDSVANRLIQPFKGQVQTGATLSSILAENSPEALAKKQQDAQQKYLNQEGAEYAELGAIAADIASIIDPEPFSAAGLALGAAGARNWAKLQQPGKWSWKDYGGQALDYLTSVIGAIPVVGDAALAAKVIKSLRRLGRMGAWMDTVNTVPALKTIWDKKINGNESLTVEDWRTIGQAIRGLVSHGRMNQSNLAARQVMKQRGVNVTPENVKGIKANVSKWAQKTGFTQTKPTKSSQTSTSVRIKDENGNIVEVPVTERVKQDLETKFKGKSNEEKLKIVKDNPDVQTAARGKIDLTKATGLDASSSIRNIRGIRNFVGTNKGIFSSQTNYSQIPRTTDNFENYLKTRSNWDKIKYGTNNYLRRIDRQLNLGSVQTPTNNPELRSDKALENSLFTPERILKRQTKVIKTDNHGNNGIKGDATIEYEGMKFKYDADYNSYLQFVNGKWQKINNIKSQEEFKKFIAEMIKRHHNISSVSDIKQKLTDAQIQKIKELKRKGFLYKQGGTIDRQRIQNYKEFINK